MMYKSVLQYLEETNDRFSNKVAFADNDKEISFSELVSNAKKIGTGLLEIVRSQQPVVVYMKKGADNIVAFFASVYAGCFYVPIDSKMPIERVQLILETLDPPVIIYDMFTENKLTQLYKYGRGILYDDLLLTDVDQTKLALRRVKAKSTDILYVLFTSGSTGKPKGVTISHSAIIDFMTWICKKYSLDNTISLCNQAPFYFDASVPDIYIPIKTGATTYIPPQTYYKFPQQILKYIFKNNINTLIWVPSALCNVVSARAFDIIIPTSIKLVIFCGEVMPCKYLNAWRRVLPHTLYVNMYGPTEATYACMYYDINREFDDDDKLPLGTACDNSTILLLNGEREAEIGEIGEICVLGQCLSQGYYKDLEKTQIVFTQNPLNPCWNERMYHTGDLAVIDEKGEMLYIGRVDSQIKRSGFRIELGEIESALLSMDGVLYACCIYSSESNELIGFYSGGVENEPLFSSLENKIPRYMLPNKLIHLDEIPMNINGKIDRMYLKEKYFKGELL